MKKFFDFVWDLLWCGWWLFWLIVIGYIMIFRGLTGGDSEYYP